MVEIESGAKSVTVSIPRVLFSGESQGCGASTVTIGVLAALKRKGVSIGAGVVGSRLIQATHYRRITGTLVHSLNLWMLEPGQMLETLCRLSSSAEIVIIEGEQPLFDVYPSDFSFQEESLLLDALKLPVVLIVDARGVGQTIAARIHGFHSLRPGVRVSGVIANRVQSAEHNEEIRSAIQQLGGPLYLGGIPEDIGLQGILDSSDQTSPSLLSRGAVVAAGELVQRHIDLGALQQIAAKCEAIQIQRSVLNSRSRTAKVAVADDMAFHVMFQSNLDLLRREGAELVAFSPVVDRKLPNGVKGVYIPGGYPNLYASELSANIAMHEALRKFVAHGGILLAEGNSVGYLCRTAMLSSGTRLEMAGILPANATLLTDRLTSDRASYVNVRGTEPTIFTRTGDRFRGHRDYQWAVRLDEPVPTGLQIDFRSDGPEEERLSSIPEGFLPSPNVLITSVQGHWASNPLLARFFMQNTEQSRAA